MSRIEIQEAVDGLRYLTERKREIDEAIDYLQNNLKEEMIHAQRDELRGENFHVTWKSYEQRRLDSKAMREYFPTLCERYTTVTEVRRFILR